MFWPLQCLQAFLVVLVCTMPDLLLRELSQLMSASKALTLVVTLLAVITGGLYLLHLSVFTEILVLAAGSFYGRLPQPVTDLSEAYRLLTPMLGTSLASVLFGVALLAAGQSSTLTATMAGQIVMEGFLQIRLPDWKRRLLTRGLALIPAMATVILFGERATTNLLVLSQVVLSLQLPFAVIPLVWFCGRRGLMGDLKAPLLLQAAGWICASVIVLINLSLLSAVLRGV
jgi:manganese transport protein